MIIQGILYLGRIRGDVQIRLSEVCGAGVDHRYIYLNICGENHILANEPHSVVKTAQENASGCCSNSEKNGEGFADAS